jgi:nitroreductase
MSIGEVIAKSTRLGTEFLADMSYYLRFCGLSPLQDATKKRYYKLLIEAHALEKGLSLANPRPLFGRGKIDFLMRTLDIYDINHSELPAQKVLGMLMAYVHLHRTRGIQDPLLDTIETYVAARVAKLGVEPNGGLRHFDVAYDRISDLNPIDFIHSRFSSRTYAREALPRELVKKIVTTAQTAPSQCNRQATQVHFYQNPAKVLELLQLQAGSSGFAEDICNLFVVTSELSAWGGAQQRNQPFVDGALFCMSLIYAAHAYGLATCPLNLAVPNKRERQIRQAGGIPKDQRLIMMIAIGRPLVTQAVHAAKSPRRKLEEVLHFGD